MVTPKFKWGGFPLSLVGFYRIALSDSDPIGGESEGDSPIGRSSAPCLSLNSFTLPI